MDAKLTLKLNKNVIEKAKKYAGKQNKSLSRMIEAYLKYLVSRENSDNEGTIEISPFVKSIRSGKSIPEDLDYKEMYRQHLFEKYR